MDTREKELNAIVRDAHELMKELRTGNSYECAVKRMASKCFNMGMAVMPQRTHPA